MALANARPRLLAPLIAVGAVTAFVAVWLGLRIGGTQVSLWVDDVATPLAALVATVACVRARSRHRDRTRTFWLLLSLACAAWTAAELIWGYYALILGRSPVTSWADVGYLAAIPLAAAALMAHPATRARRSHKTRWLLDGLLSATALLFLSWTLVLGSLWHSSDLGTLTGVVNVAYPFGDVVIVFFAVLAIRGMTGADRISLWCLLVALMVLALSDSTYTYLVEAGRYTNASLIDAGWVAAYLGIALAAHVSGGEASPAAAPESSRPTLAALVAPLVPVLTALAVAAVNARNGHHLDRAGWLMAYVLIGLVLTRQALTVWELWHPGHPDGSSLMTRLTRSALGGPTAAEEHYTVYRGSAYEQR